MEKTKQQLKDIFLNHSLELDGSGHKLREQEAAALADELCQALINERNDDMPTVKDRAGLRFVLDPWSWDEASGSAILHVMVWGGYRWMYMHEIPFVTDDVEST